MKKLFIASLIATLMLCFSAHVTLAQSADREGVPFCGDLTPADCTRLDAIAIRMGALTSGSSHSQVRVFGSWAGAGIPELSLIAATEFTFVIDPNDLARMLELQMMTPAELLADQAALAEAIRLPAAIDRAQVVTVDFSPDLVQNLADNFGVVVPTPVSFQVRVVDETLYIRLADFAFLGAQPDWVPEWLGIQLRHLLNTSINVQLANPEFGEDDVATIQAALTPPGTRFASTIIYHVPEDELAAYADFMRLTALGMQDRDGTLVTTFATEWDVPRYVGGPLFAAQMEIPHPSATARAYASFATLMFDGLVAASQQSVGLNDSRIYAVETELTWAIGLPGGTFEAERPTIGIAIALHNRDLDSVESIPVPDNVFTPPINFVFAIINLLQS